VADEAGGEAAGAELAPVGTAGGELEAAGAFAGTRFTRLRWMTTGRALSAAALVATVGSPSFLRAIPAPARPPTAIAVAVAATFIRVGFSMPRTLGPDSKLRLREA
jgi:hypothetical protein